jgi:hypothetical protein
MNTGTLVLARTAAKFKQADVVRAIKAARVGGFVIGSVEISSAGHIILHYVESKPAPVSEFEAWKAKRVARPS